MIAYAAAGATSAEIAQAMQRSVHTIRDHLKEVYTRLGVASRAELASVVSGIYEYAGQ